MNDAKSVGEGRREVWEAETKKGTKNSPSTDLMKQNVTLKFLHHNRAKQERKNAKTQQRKKH
jgi:hypothetical protein